MFRALAAFAVTTSITLSSFGQQPSDPPADVLSKVPPVRTFARLAPFNIAPSGPGYYSALDYLQGNYRQAAPKYGYPRTSPFFPGFYDADFRYLDNPKNTDFDSMDPLKRVRLGDNWLFSNGGELRNRYMNENNSRLTQTKNAYDLFRVRTYGDLWFRDDFRIFAEFYGGYSSQQALAPAANDINKADFQNLFFDLRLFDFDGKPSYVRLGRQEMSLGSQRLVSSPDWSNTRRTFDGVRGFRQGEKWDLDAFWLRPVVPNPNDLDSSDRNQDFAGTWLTYRPRAGTAVDLYYLLLDNRNTTSQLGIVRSPETVNTIGSRYSGDKDGFLWDFEGALQFGSINGTTGRRDLFAGMATAGVGYNWKEALLHPTLWLYYDYASGTNGDPNSGTSHTFQQLFPAGHNYLGWTDVVGRQNIHDLNAHLFLYPAPWITCWFQYHHFWLASSTDAMYSSSGAAIRRDATGRAGNDVGNELDTIVNFHLTKHSDILTGYSHLFGGDFLKKIATPTAGSSTGIYFLTYSYKW